MGASCEMVPSSAADDDDFLEAPVNLSVIKFKAQAQHREMTALRELRLSPHQAAGGGVASSIPPGNI